MLFSDRKIADYINATFEPSWESVRAVPTVSIDFGDGRTETKTFRGNVATYICFPDGTVFDILPGIYDADTYLAQLKRVVSDMSVLRQRQRNEIAAYHQRRVGTNTGHPVDAMFDVISGRMKQGDADSLIGDAKANETTRRILIHRHLADGMTYRPTQLTKWLYADVLHCDLDDRYVGAAQFLSNAARPSQR